MYKLELNADKIVYDVLYELITSNLARYTLTKDLLLELFNSLKDIVSKIGYEHTTDVFDSHNMDKHKRLWRSYDFNNKKVLCLVTYDEYGIKTSIRFDLRNGEILDENGVHITNIMESDCIEMVAIMFCKNVNNICEENDIIECIESRLGSAWEKIKIVDLFQNVLKKNIDTINIIEKMKGKYY